MNLKRLTAFGLATVMAAGVFIGSLGMARAAKDDYSVKTAVEDRLEANEKAIKAMTKADRTDLTDRFNAAFKAQDFTELSFQERAAVMDAEMFKAYLTERGFASKDIKTLETARAKAVATMPAAKEEASNTVEFKVWLYSEAFDEVILAQKLTDDQAVALLSEENRVVWTIGLASSYLRQLGLNDKDRETVYNAVMAAYRELAQITVTDPSGYDADNYAFDAMVSLIESGRLDDMVKNRDKKTGEMSGAQMVELAEILDAVRPVDENEVLQASQAANAVNTAEN